MDMELVHGYTQNCHLGMDLCMACALTNHLLEEEAGLAEITSWYTGILRATLSALHHTHYSHSSSHFMAAHNTNTLLL